MSDSMTDVTLQMVGEQLFEANKGIADLKTHVMGMEDRINDRFDGIDTRLDGVDNRLDGVDNRLDNIETLLSKVAAHLGIQ